MIRKVKKLNRRTNSIMQFALTLFLLYRQLSGFPFEFIVPIWLFLVSPYLAYRYSDKTLKFYKNSNDIIIVDLRWFSNFSYILAIITYIFISSLDIILRLGLLEKTGMNHKLNFFFFCEAMTIFLMVTIIFDFLLMY